MSCDCMVIRRVQRALGLDPVGKYLQYHASALRRMPSSQRNEVKYHIRHVMNQLPRNTQVLTSKRGRMPALRDPHQRKAQQLVKSFDSFLEDWGTGGPDPYHVLPFDYMVALHTGQFPPPPPRRA